MQTSEIKSARLRDLLCAALLLSFALAIAYPRWRAGMDWRDEGLLAYGAVRVMHGEVPQRDFVSVQPPLSFTQPLAFSSSAAPHFSRSALSDCRSSFFSRSSCTVSAATS